MNENEIVAVDNSTAPSLTNSFDIVDVQAAADFMQNYQDLVNALLQKSDYQMIGGNAKKKKSAWRKLATAFNISDDIVEKEIIREENHQIISAWFVVKATLPNGRYGIGVGDCSIFDKVKKEDTEMPSNFELRKRFNNAEHDVLSTAHTRAKSRAISDLIGGGEVSAEELSGMDKTVPKPSIPKPKTNGKTSNLGNKTPKPKAPAKNHEAIEVEAKPVEPKPMKAKPVEPKTVKAKPASFKEICDSDNSLSLAVEELQVNETAVNKNTVLDKLLDLWDIGRITDEEYKTAKALLE